jgi:MerR family transcriptional regulator, heat shock protein HspR
MTKEYFTSAEIVRIFQVEESFIAEMVEWEIVCPTCPEDSQSRIFDADDMEKLRIAKMLMEEMDVNPPGVEIILQMRQNMIAMRKQFDDILEAVQGQFKNILKERLKP